MEVDLAELREMHSRLPVDVAWVMVGRAALALERNEHKATVPVSVDFDHEAIKGLLSWPAAELGNIDQHDENRITEDGAEAVVLAVVHRQRAWRIVRRLQREEHADWLLEEDGETGRQVIALEVSGVARGTVSRRIREKLDQVAKSMDVEQRWAGVVGFEEPTTVVRAAKE